VPFPSVGVFALQGDVREHLKAFSDLGVPAFTVRRPEELARCDALVLPGGESTTMYKLARAFELFEPLVDRIRGGMPTFGTCAGMIMLADRIVDGLPQQEGLHALDIAVRRNGYGRQLDSFEAQLQVSGLAGGPFPGVFIRAPVVEDAGTAEVLASHEGRPVAVRQGSVMALAFHPELSGDLRLHREFLRLARSRQVKEPAWGS
jgi:5'-phosphate synthase pdxT subunit